MQVNREAEREATRRFQLRWIAAARPPAHPEPMVGLQSFTTFDAAVEFMKRQASDAKFVSLVEFVERSNDRSADAILALRTKEPSRG